MAFLHYHLKRMITPKTSTTPVLSDAFRLLARYTWQSDKSAVQGIGDAMDEKGITRRGFIGAATMGAVAIGTGLVGCSNPSVVEEGDGSDISKDIAKTYDADIVVVGLGMSGLVAAVQAAANGAKVIGVESMAQTGGNGIGVEGIFAVGTDMAREAGYDVKPADVVHAELGETQWVANGVAWKTLVQSSADNVEWLKEQGVEFSGVVDDYLGFSQVPGFHWFEGGTANTGYIPQMTARAEELGVEIFLNTSFKEIIKSNDTISGIYAQNEDGENVQINTKAVILATGSYGNSEEFIRQRGFNWDNFQYGGTPGHDGDGLRAAFEVGARNFVSSSTFNCTNTIGTSFNYKGVFMQRFGGGGNHLWVNEKSERFISEDFAATNFEMQSVPAMTQNTMYVVFDRGLLEASLTDNPDALAEVDAANEKDLSVADTLEEVAEKAGLDIDAFIATVEQYNELCEQGADSDFGKTSSLMVALTNAPFYVGKLSQYYLVAIGGIECDVNAQCLDENKEPIEGLYAVGTDGCMLYRNIYPINIGGTCNANNINSGRTAANHASEYILGL